MYIGEVRFFGGASTPQNLLPADGRVVLTSGNEVLAGVLGVAGNAQFLLPDFRSRTVTGAEPFGYLEGGAETVQLAVANLPSHSHTVGAHGTATTDDPTGAVFAGGGPNIYCAAAPNTNLGPISGSTGSGAAHDNMPPFCVLNILIVASGGVTP